ncbi:leucine-rich repeat protein [Clostridium saccharobutylicum]|nr:leucine-rich repeat protein [Clostridium saccharobutylicum]MBA8790061.1 hypothetical protein [Clostridium saccharobutylicum]MBC2401347.1 leucine-rich repeat protein [Clostridium saccharobutylicum]MBC2412768.1 leucine-rich repeat protein [Clostridium saccharobutylicum]MBC2442288.1 leucine-rich repeat protein [Clostridium saccharobutylicum]MBC2444902.1 leucine-rich repeat protein [Clostridium saccharobutylicum]
MIKLKLTKVMASSLILASVFALNPIGASAEWKKDSKGWWYTEGDSWATGLREINGKQYYFDKTGYMVEDKIVDNLYFDSNGARTEYICADGFAVDKLTGTIIKFSRQDARVRPGEPGISVVIPREIGGVEIKGIGGKAFKICTNIKSITIPDSVTNIEDWTFSDCYKLESITIPDSVTNIGEYAFVKCVNLKSITIPTSVTSIGDSAFRECNKLTSITIPDSVTSIGDYAFSDCNNAIFYVGNEKTKQLILNSNSKIDSNKIIIKSQII